MSKSITFLLIFAKVIGAYIKCRSLSIENPTLEVVIAEPLKKPYIKEIPDTLKAMQDVVQGHIGLFDILDRQIAFLCNDNGKAEGLPLNRKYFNDIIAGNILVCAMDDEGANVSLNQEQIKKVLDQFDQVEFSQIIDF